MSVGRAVREWVHGWASTRGTPAPVVEPDGHRVRYVLPDVSTVDSW
ncbi:hypothetical protein NLX83_36760 [Allokutzneria sp. A3M-2-11 16]|nr:hypothetical protein [Allokutzneria sp. A3M-2-11 16]MCP3804833.1 hypothetical protein [Allokutzneria sp. A3M-2-11 16]